MFIALAYHVDDTENFYQRASEWAVSQDPGRTGEGAANVVLVDEQGFQVGVRHRRMAPYRTMVALPDGEASDGSGSSARGASDGW